MQSTRVYIIYIFDRDREKDRQTDRQTTRETGRESRVMVRQTHTMPGRRRCRRICLFYDVTVILKQNTLTKEVDIIQQLLYLFQGIQYTPPPKKKSIYIMCCESFRSISALEISQWCCC